MKNIFDKISKFYREKAVPILVCVLAVLIVLLIFVLLLGGGQESSAGTTKYQEWMIQLRNKDIAECPYDCINDFFDEYYTALCEGDTTTLETLVDDTESSNITTELSSIVESYSDITVYVTPGINEDEVLAFVSYNINFVNIESEAPAVDSFYLKADTQTNTVYIMAEMYTDADINAFMYLASYREPVRSLLSDTEEDLNAILEEDAELRNIYIIMNAMSEESTSSESSSDETTQAQEDSGSEDTQGSEDEEE